MPTGLAPLLVFGEHLTKVSKIRQLICLRFENMFISGLRWRS